MNDLNQKLKQADADYGVGNFRTATRDARDVQSSEEATDAQKETASSLLRRMRSDPVATVVFGVTFFILIFLAIKFAL